MRAWVLQDVPADKKWVVSACITECGPDRYVLSASTIYGSFGHMSTHPSLTAAKKSFGKQYYPKAIWLETTLER